MNECFNNNKNNSGKQVVKGHKYAIDTHFDFKTDRW